jgi:hypothetical protein
VYNANAGDPAANVLMDVREKFPGYTHIALRVASIPVTIAALKANDIAITQGPVASGRPGTSRCSSATPTETSSNCAVATSVPSRAPFATCRNGLRLVFGAFLISPLLRPLKCRSLAPATSRQCPRRLLPPPAHPTVTRRRG